MRASRWLVVFGFGLVHGLGFAGVLRDLGLPGGGFWPALIGFNLGVELGQIAVIALAFAATRWAWHKPWYHAKVTVPASTAIILAALYWVVERLWGGS
jgi:hypothetical protein